MKSTDRVSWALAAAIAVLVAVNCVIIYRTWLSGPPEISETESPKTELAFNDDTSVTNNGDGKLWIRARIILRDNAGSEEKGEGAQMISRAMDEGIWMGSGDGWYYYAGPIEEGETTRPLLDSLVNGENGEERGYRFRIEAEAVDESWLPEAPDSCIEAFTLFKPADEKDVKACLL